MRRIALLLVVLAILVPAEAAPAGASASVEHHGVPHRTSAPPVKAPPGHFPWDQTVMIAIVALLFLGGWLAAGDTVPARERRAARGRRRATPRAVA